MVAAAEVSGVCNRVELKVDRFVIGVRDPSICPDYQEHHPLSDPEGVALDFILRILRRNSQLLETFIVSASKYLTVFVPFETEKHMSHWLELRDFERAPRFKVT